jgi:hypothetical protein
MGKVENGKTDFDASQTPRQRHPVRRIGRMILCVLSMGMIFPNAFTEGIDLQDYETRNNRTPKQ